MMTPQLPGGSHGGRGALGLRSRGCPGALGYCGVLGGTPGPVSCTHRAVPGDGKVRPSLHERHRPAEVRGQEHLQPGAAPALGQRRGAVRGGHPVWGEVATYWNSDPEWREHRRAAVDSPFLVERRGEHGAERVLSGPALGMTLEPLKTSVGITPEPSIQLRWFQGQQELSEHMVATDVVPNGDWTHQLLVLLETSAAQRGVSSSCQVEHVSLEQPLSWHWARPSPTPTVPEAVGEVLGGLRGGLGCAGIN
uniref:Immunoglobulin C1-set domain-containing protein n=1 Tax=Zosterops lateralis melanops TaxID=1220523 RepID=A0A8D2PAL2_ZOSLA